MNFSLEIFPGATLKETKFKLHGTYPSHMYGSQSNGAYDYAQLGIDWIKDKKPEWEHRAGIISALKPSIYKMMEDKADFALRPTALTHHVFDNSDGDDFLEGTAKLESSITNTTSITWSQRLSIEATVGVEVGSDSFGKASASLSVTTEVGKDQTKEKTSEVGSATEVTVPVKPHEVGLVLLYLEQGTVDLYCSLTSMIQGGLYIGLPGGHSTYVSGAELQKYSREPKAQLKARLDFCSQSEVKNKTIPDASDAAVEKGINDILAEAARKYEEV